MAKEVKQIDDVFKFKTTEAYAIGLLLFGLLIFIFGIFKSYKVEDQKKLLYENLYKESKLIEFYEKSKEINSAQEKYKIDFLKADELVNTFDKLKDKAKKIGILKSFSIANVFFDDDKKIENIKISIAGETSFDDYQKLLKEMSYYEILSKQTFSGPSERGKYVVDLVIYYKGTLPANYKDSEYKPENKDKIMKEIEEDKKTEEEKLKEKQEKQEKEEKKDNKKNNSKKSTVKTPTKKKPTVKKPTVKKPTVKKPKKK